MTAEEAKNLLKKNNIDPLLYSVGEPRSTQCDVLEERNGVWLTYYWERGLEHFKKEHPNEATAVADFVNCVVKSASLNERRKIVLEY